MKFDAFTYDYIDYLIDRSDPEVLYHFCKNDIVNGSFEAHLCSRELHKYYYHATYWTLHGDMYCPWCQIIVPKILGDNFTLRKNWFNTICLECEK